jgi:outer membrane receptor protein involved in Fe transport
LKPDRFGVACPRLNQPRFRSVPAAFVFPLALGLLGSAPPVRGQTSVLAPVVVSASRTAQTPADTPVATAEFSAQDLASFPAITLDDTLRDDPSFSLFRRTSSLTSNPTSQGVSLRDIGPSGASRSLVLLDGVPLNDPFGGWVVWSAVPRLFLQGAEIEHGGGSGVWGNGALAGSISLVSAPPANGGEADFEAGAFGTRSAEVAAGAVTSQGSMRVDARDFSTDGFYNLTPSTRGAVDRPLSSDHRLAEATVEKTVGRVTATVTGSLFDESRGNGTVLQNNTTHEAQVSLALRGASAAGFDWNAVAYAERESFSSYFTSVAANRATETPANNQFDVPATAGGASVTLHWTGAESSTSIGADARQVEGETREDFSFVNGAFTGIRFAGGAQDFGGLFLHHDRELLPGLRLSADLRLDEWMNRSGHDREYKLVNGVPTLLAKYPTQSGAQASPNVGLVWQPSQPWRLRAAIYRGFRVPTLNEYYRPFRVGTVTTQANPNLTVEDLYGAEVGASYGAGPLDFQATVFADELYHAVGTVTLSQTPAASTVQRQNLDAVRTRGAELSARWTPAKDLHFRVGYLYDEAIVTKATEEPDLTGLRLPEVPRGTLTAALEGDGPWGLHGEARVRWVGLQFDDTVNTLRLPPATVADFELSRNFGKRFSAYLALENAFNAEVAASLSTAGLFTYDAPRLLRGGIRFGW